jgi:hypothetical protein
MASILRYFNELRQWSVISAADLPAATPPFEGRSSQTGAYAVLNTDKNSIISLGGNSFYVLTFNAASGYDSDFIVIVVNTDAGRAKCISPNGLTSFYLWPLQTIIIYNDANTWQVLGRSRWIWPTGFTFNVDHANGSDVVTVSDGLGTGAGAFATIQNGVNIIMDQVDCVGFAPTIQNAAETFTESVAIREYPLGYLEIFITGSPSTPSNTVWKTSSIALSCRDGGTATVNGFKFVATTTNCGALAPSQFGVIDVANVEFGDFTSGYHIQSTEGGSFNSVGGTYTVSGNFITHWLLQGSTNLFVTSQAISVPNALTFTNWLQIIGPGYFQGNGTTFSGIGSGAGSAGQKYNITLDGIAFTAGAVLPGATAGTADTGGWYDGPTAWKAWTPTVTPAAGAGLTYTVNSASYEQVGKRISFHFDIKITAAGTGSGHMFVTLPVTARSQVQVMFGQEVGLTGKSAFAVIGAALGDFTKVSMSYFDNTDLIATNAQIICSGTYEAA